MINKFPILNKEIFKSTSGASKDWKRSHSRALSSRREPDFRTK